MRFLCLHGIGTSSEILEAQLSSIRFHLDNSHEFEFVEGQFVWPPAPGIEEAFGKQEAYYSYFDGTLQSIHQAVLDLAEYLDSEGPFDGVIGFSQGGALAATLLAAESRGLLPPFETTGNDSRLKCAIFLSCGQPWDFAALESGVERRLSAEADGVCIRIPTAHFWGSNDMEGFLGNHEVVSLCEEKNRVVSVHKSGHGIPTASRPADLMGLVKGLERTIQRVFMEKSW
ncbi:hypothetical protein KVR01_007145 [Diaporthe batatas]|uniref:uncharacterized protein n=1 Tax=Diaporthe batatas TaxID=748121 RepID=UPI001D043C23|nr:uncharacterized protein KVR01_007145 [Diaporthe batatas]KAG8162667.1 hypothetical protein KVR01_007145 [Diaporthe batatas]